MQNHENGLSDTTYSVLVPENTGLADSDTTSSVVRPVIVGAKPRLKWLQGRWFCDGGGFRANGATPAHAYQGWRMANWTTANWPSH